MCFSRILFPISFPALMFSLAVSFFGFFLSFSPVPVMFSYVFFVHSVSFIFHIQLDVVPSNCFYTHSVFFFASHAAVGWGRVSVPLPTGPAGPLRPCRRPPGSVAVAWVALRPESRRQMRGLVMPLMGRPNLMSHLKIWNTIKLRQWETCEKGVSRALLLASCWSIWS